MIVCTFWNKGNVGILRYIDGLKLRSSQLHFNFYAPQKKTHLFEVSFILPGTCHSRNNCFLFFSKFWKFWYSSDIMTMLIINHSVIVARSIHVADEILDGVRYFEICREFVRSRVSRKKWQQPYLVCWLDIFWHLWTREWSTSNYYIHKTIMGLSRTEAYETLQLPIG